MTAYEAELKQLREALQEADTLMGHDDAESEWRERWAFLWADKATVQPAGGTPVDRRVRPRAAFEAWISAPPYERDIERFGEGSAWPGNYRDINVDLAWNAWLDAMTMTRERCAKLCEEVHADTGECPEMALYCAARIRGA